MLRAFGQVTASRKVVVVEGSEQVEIARRKEAGGELGFRATTTTTAVTDN